MASVSAIEIDKYSMLEDFNVDVEVEDEDYESFSLCFWVYLLNSTTFPSAIIRQVIHRTLGFVSLFRFVIMFDFALLSTETKKESEI